MYHRPAAFAAKARQDRSQAEQMFRVLLQDRPSDITLAYEAAKAQGDVFEKSFKAGLGMLNRDIADALSNDGFELHLEIRIAAPAGPHENPLGIDADVGNRRIAAIAGIHRGVGPGAAAVVGELDVIGAAPRLANV